MFFMGLVPDVRSLMTGVPLEGNGSLLSNSGLVDFRCREAKFDVYGGRGRGGAVPGDIGVEARQGFEAQLCFWEESDCFVGLSGGSGPSGDACKDHEFCAQFGGMSSRKRLRRAAHV